MKSIASFLVLALWSVGSWAYVKVQDFPGLRVYDVAVDSITFTTKEIEGEPFQIPHFQGVEGYTGVRLREEGEAVLPVVRFYVDAQEASDIQITARSYGSKAKLTKAALPLLPTLPSLAKIRGARYAVPKMKMSQLNFNQEPYTVEVAGSVKGQKQFLVTLYPADLDPALNTLQLSRSFSVTVKTPAQKAMDEAHSGILFVVGQKFAASTSLKQYEALKAGLGMDVEEKIIAPSMQPEAIRLAIKEVYQRKNHLKYVVIVGDAEDVPAKESDIISGITDHYYACVDTDDYESDIATPDLFVGRISVVDEAQLSSVLARYSDYARGNMPSRAWLNHVSFLATDDQWELAEGTHNYAIDKYTAAKGYTGAFPQQNQSGGDKLYAVTYDAGNDEVMNAIKLGRSIINYSGHGAITYWDAPSVSQDDVRSIVSDSQPFVVSNACITGDFREDESFAETWQRAPHGAIVFWGSMDSTYWDEDDILEKRMYDGIFQLNKLEFGDITQYALKETWKHYGGEGRSDYYFETYHVFGDPSLKLQLR